MDSDPVIRVVIAGVAGAVGITVASVSGSPVVRILAVSAAVVVVFACLLSLRKDHRSETLAALAAVPILAIGLGIPAAVFAGAMDSTVSPGVGDPGFTPGPRLDSSGNVLRNPDELMRAAFDQADKLVPNGAASVLRMSIRENSVSLGVFDPSNGDDVSSSYSSGKWYGANRRRASDRRTFARAQVAGLNLQKAGAEALAVAKKLKVDMTHAYASDGITIARRHPDEKLLATFSFSGEDIQVDENGHLPDTVGAGSVETVMPVAQRVMVESGLDPGAPIVGRLDFRAFAEGAAPLSASSIQNSGGIAIRFGGGPISDIVVVPGQFPVVRRFERSSPASGFALTSVTSAALVKVRDDIMARAKSPAYDADLVAFQVGDASGYRADGVVIQMRVGPVSERPGGTYTLDGKRIGEV